MFCFLAHTTKSFCNLHKTMPDVHCTKLDSCTSGKLTNYPVISNKSWVLTEHTEDTGREHHELDVEERHHKQTVRRATQALNYRLRHNRKLIITDKLNRSHNEPKLYSNVCGGRSSMQLAFDIQHR